MSVAYLYIFGKMSIRVLCSFLILCTLETYRILHVYYTLFIYFFQLYFNLKNLRRNNTIGLERILTSLAHRKDLRYVPLITQHFSNLTDHTLFLFPTHTDISKKKKKMCFLKLICLDTPKDFSKTMYSLVNI